MKLERRAATRYNFGAVAEVIDLDQRGRTGFAHSRPELLRLFCGDHHSFPQGNASSGTHYALWRARFHSDRECDTPT